MPCPDLAAAVRAGDELAYQKLYTKYVPYLTRYLSRKNRDLSPESIEDIIHDVLLGIWIRRDTWNPVSIPAYLTSAVKKRVIDHLRLRERSDEYNREVKGDPLQSVLPSDDVTTITTSAGPFVVSSVDCLVQQSILRIPYSIYKEICVLHFYEGRTPGAIARILQLKNLEVRRIINTAREHIAADLYSHGIKNFLDDINKDRISQSLSPVTNSPFQDIIDLNSRMRRKLELRPDLAASLIKYRYSYARFAGYNYEEITLLKQLVGV